MTVSELILYDLKDYMIILYYMILKTKRLKLEDAKAILTHIFLAEVIYVLHRIWNINSLKFQHCHNRSL